MTKSGASLRDEPRDVEKASAVPCAREGSSRSRLIRVLIIDDNQELANGLARWLELAGLEAEVAHDGRSGVEAARRSRPDFVLVDIGLPGMDGAMVASDLSQDPRLVGVILIAISGYAPEDVGPAAAGNWFRHHLVKPIDHSALLRLLLQ